MAPERPVRLARILRPLASAAAGALVALGALAPASVSGASPHVPKVAVIVGPSGSATARYRIAGHEAAQVARRAGADVVEVTTPNATWPAVQRALDGASVVVYLGHGNGWPSRYRPSLYPPTQNGLGLNPVAGVDDVAHQYFGEAYLESDVRLAPNAVVVMSHLCYASGNSEPGLAEGTLDVARQRVDNYGAGWIAAGARAVVAEAYLDPAYYVGAVLSGQGSVASAWRNAPTYHGNVLRFDSQRRPGFVDLLDPVSSGGPGFTRSLVVRGEVASRDVVAGGQGTTAGGQITERAVPAAPTLASLGARIDAPSIAGLPVAGARRRISVPISLPSDADATLLDGLELSVRWDPLDVAPSQRADPAAAPDGTGTSTPAAADGSAPHSSTPSGSSATAGTPDLAEPTDSAAPADASASTQPAASTDETPSAPPADPAPDPFALVLPEVPGDVVDPVRAKATQDGWQIRAALPSRPGLYSLTVRLHDADAVAFDEASQVLVPRLLVRVVGATSARILAPTVVTVAAGTPFTLPVAAMNTGRAAWAVPEPAARPNGRALPAGPVRITAHWVGLASGSAPADDETGSAPAGGPTDGTVAVYREVRPLGRVTGSIQLTAPSAPGTWLLVVDVSTPETPSLVAAGSDPSLVRVVVGVGGSTDTTNDDRS